MQLAHVVIGEDGDSLQPIAGSVSGVLRLRRCCVLVRVASSMQALLT
jgi:hypothetical protein